MSIQVVFCNLMCPRCYFILYSRNVFPHPINHMLWIEENNPKGKYKVKHRTHTIPDHMPSGHGNIKHMAHPMDKSNPKGQDKVKHRTHTIPDRIPSKYDNSKHMIYRMGEYIRWFVGVFFACVLRFILTFPFGLRSLIRCVICFISSCPHVMCSFILCVICFTLSCQFI
jgi:hypothetical protein